MSVRSSLKLRLAISIGALALVSSMLMSQFASSLSREQIEHDQSALLQNIVVRMNSQLAQDMSTRANEILFLTGIDRIRDPKISAELKRGAFEQARNAYPFYAWIGVTDTEGNIIAGTDDLLVGKSVAKRDWFIKGREGLHFGDAHDAFLLAKLLPQPKWDDLPLRLVDISAPVYDKDGKFMGVLCGHLSLDWAFEVRERMLDQLSRDYLDLVVLNKEGKVLMGTPALPSLKVDLASLKSYQGLADNLRQVAVEIWPDGKSYLTASAREVAFRNYPGMGWVVVARKSEAVAFAPANELSRLILAGGLLTAMLFGLVLWLMLSRNLRPLEKLSMVAQRIREEDLSAPIPQLDGNDEVAVFSRSLTGLVHSLQDRNNELRLASRVFEESGQGILITDANNHVLRVNRSFTRITGYAPEEVIGKTPAVLSSGKQDAAFYQAMWNSLKLNGAWQGDIWNRHKSGHVFQEWLTINTLRDGGGITHYIGIFDDITERTRLGEELKKHRDHLESLVEERTEEMKIARQEAETANLSKRAFLANMSHEIRTPLNAITGMAHLLRRSSLTPQQADKLNKIETAGHHLLQVINDVLDLSKIEAGKFVLEDEPVHVEALLGNIASMLGQKAKDKGLGFHIETTSLPQTLHGDPTRLQQALLNYVANAIKFTESGHITLRVKQEARADETTTLRFEVEDTGIGISSEVLPKLFGAFEQADNLTTRKYGGTGLGLAITKKVAEAMGGTAGVSSTAGQGSIFWFTATLRTGGQPAKGATSVGVKAAEQTILREHAGKRILLAEDDPINREIAQMLLEDVGIDVDLAEDGQEAVAKASSGSYAVILMDMQMPRMDGLDATRHIRQLPDCEPIPILAMTANAFAENKDQCLEAGMDDFISKPVNPDFLYETLLHWLEKGQH
jgi:PAS domain S-box-containing protein